MSYKNEWLNACFSSGKPAETATVYKDGEKFATYSKNVAFEVAAEIGGEVIDDITGEILFN